MGGRPRPTIRFNGTMGGAATVACLRRSPGMQPWYCRQMISGPKSDIARLRQQLHELEDELVVVDAVATQQMELLRGTFRGQRWRRSAALGIVPGLLIAAALAWHIEAPVARASFCSSRLFLWTPAYLPTEEPDPSRKVEKREANYALVQPTKGKGHPPLHRH